MSMELEVVNFFASLQAINNIMKQEMDMDSAEKISRFFTAYMDVLSVLEEERQEYMEIADEAKRIAQLEEFAKEKRRLDIESFNVKEFPFLRLTPDDVVILKRAGLYA